MNNVYHQDDIERVLDILNASELDYLLIRNINNELPANLKLGKDIDILVKHCNKYKWKKFLKKNGFSKRLIHPYRWDIRLYGVDLFDMYREKQTGILLDFQYQLVCRSMNNREWIPLDQEIQESAWRNKKVFKFKNSSCFGLSDEDNLVCLIIRSLLDKKKFDNNYISEIKKLIKLANIEIVINKLNKVVFNFAESLIISIQKEEYEYIPERYISFTNY